MNNKICQKYNRKYIIPTYSATLAIEGILKSLDLNKQTRVLISSISCYSILEAILNANLTPVIATPKNGIIFTKNEIEMIVKKYNINIYIAVDQYGYYQEIPNINKLIVINDVSQSWDLSSLDKKKIEYNGDYIVTSLGKSKPLNNGIGGLIITDVDILSRFDLKTRDDRYKEYPLLEYYYPLRINYRKIVNKANRKVKRQRRNAKLFDNIFKRYSFVNVYRNDKFISSYHRYVIDISNEKKSEIIEILNKSKINYELEHRIKLTHLPITKKLNIQIIDHNQNSNYILIKPNNRLLNIIKLRKEMKVKYEKESTNTLY